MIILIDNYDSFTWNLVHFLGDIGARDVNVIRNDKATCQEIIDMKPSGIMLSPGPCTPERSGICVDLVKQAGEIKLPVFGVCLGHQSIAQSFGANITRAPLPVHGKVDKITHCGKGIFDGLASPFTATRYHSLIVDRKALPQCLEITAQTGDIIMGISHKTLPIHGVQFHPESIATEHGHKILENFIKITK